MIEPTRGGDPTLADLAGHVRSRLAAYKAPRHLVVVESLNRAPNGKVDYKTLRRRAAEELGVALDERR